MLMRRAVLRQKVAYLIDLLHLLLLEVVWYGRAIGRHARRRLD
jgi:hypothetical protein